MAIAYVVTGAHDGTEIGRALAAADVLEFTRRVMLWGESIAGIELATFACSVTIRPTSGVAASIIRDEARSLGLDCTEA